MFYWIDNKMKPIVMKRSRVYDVQHQIDRLNHHIGLMLRRIADLTTLVYTTGPRPWRGYELAFDPTQRQWVTVENMANEVGYLRSQIEILESRKRELQ